ncbi:DUF3397 domain-containing protein [Filobacillus milosensis]|uniref:DUF3397 domain-containing protein n=1 Tax=Filobacillus milosensis TaxID=94137 RepID=A0A4Y8IRK8_9BACI|nr:DUF3397 domain-containing protein [Filobacillus milosensis]TFB23308.1 DUF3397 domain-containing protein [Filobacillus milosensis]
MDLLLTLVAILATIPYISFFILFFVLKKVTNQATRSTKIAADLSSVFFIIAVNALLYLIFENSFLTWTIITYMLAIIAVITIQWKNEIDINIWQAARIVWRGGFILLALSYLVLVPIGIYLTY